MKDQSKISNRQTSPDIPNVISSRVSAGGPSRSNWPDGLTADQFGRDLVPANLSARQAKELGLLPSGIYGRPGSISSASANLQSSLENRLKRRLNTDGSILFKMTWKHVATPSGQRFCLLRALARRTSDQEDGLLRNGWPTPRSAEAGPDFAIENRSDSGGMSLQTTAQLTGWITPQARDHKNTQHRDRVQGEGLDGQVKLTGQIRLTSTGQILTGSSAEMENGGQLNPAHSRWLMGYPQEWDVCAVTAMPSSRK